MSNKEYTYLKFWPVQETEIWSMCPEHREGKGQHRVCRGRKSFHHTRLYTSQSLAFVLFETEKLLKGFKQLPNVKSILIEPSCYFVSTRVNKIKLY